MRYLFFSVILLTSTLLSFSQTFKVDTIQFSGNIEKRINVVILGDGYQSSEMETFTIDAQNFFNEWFRQSPFQEYKNFFNVFTIEVPSNVSGASLDPDNLIDNYFGSAFNSYGIERLLVPKRSSKVVTVLANNFPEYDQVIMLVNSTKYGGSGGWIATASTHSSSGEIAIHEIGHSFSHLSDEYWAGEQYASEKPNQTKESNQELVKWKNWLNINEVGIYEYESPGEGWFRPHQQCKMRSLFKPFCPVCGEQIFETIYNFTSPVLNYFPVNTDYVFTNSEETFTLDLLKPEPNTLKIEWTLNGKPISGNTDSLKLLKSTLNKGINNLQVTVSDTASLSKKVIKETSKEEIINWSIENLSTGIEKNELGNNDFHIYPNPTTGKINITFFNKKQTTNLLEVYTTDGRLVRKINLGKRNSGKQIVSVDLFSIQENILFLKLISNDTTEVKKVFLKR
ncbi:MAG: T9SS type A sorting domain-containing protein [Bacteroidetes bacterium]|nr:T9SS type A sorting domain-containing protein [Bacteroidota bacterium]